MSPITSMGVPRREFLHQMSAVTALGSFARLRRDAWARTPDELLPEIDEALACRLALVAVEAARAAGAEFADVRLSGVRSFFFSAHMDRSTDPWLRGPRITFPSDYGVRVLVNGAWGFAGGYALAPDAVAEVARTAVARARANRPLGARRVALAPTPRVERGTWATPIEQDPFAVPIGEHAELMFAALAAAKQVRGVFNGVIQHEWEQTLHVFASSEHSLIVQRLASAFPNGYIEGKSRDDHIGNSRFAKGIRAGGYGFEAVQHAKFDYVAAMRDAAKRAVAESGPPGPAPISAEVGRYDLVLGTIAVNALLRKTLAPALNLERALGYDANGEGTSFAAPPSEILGQYRIAAPLLTLRANRTQPHASATVGWDDEGVPAGEHTLIDRGIIVDYLTSRQTAAEVAPLYQARGQPSGSRGCVVGRGQDRPEVRLPNLTLDPGPESLSMDDLIAATKRGYYVPQAYGVSDQQLLSGQFKGVDVREIRGGKLGRSVKDFAFHFVTPQLWTKIDALGGPNSAIGGGRNAVPMRAREMNVINTGITL